MVSQQTPLKRKPKKQPDSRTKFDVWLESHLSNGEQVLFLFASDPLDDESTSKKKYMCNILTVDRYMVYVEISLGEDHIPVWVAKDNIISAQ